MKLFKPFTLESVFVGLGITALMYLITPVIKDFASDVKTNKKVFYRDEDNGNGKIIYNKNFIKQL